MTSTLLTDQRNPGLPGPSGLAVSAVERREVKKSTKEDSNRECFEALATLQAWIMRLKADGLAKTRGKGLLDLFPEATTELCVGIADDKEVFLAGSDFHMVWLLGIPWLHVAVRKGGACVSLVSRLIETKEEQIEPFALTFYLERPEITARVARAKTVGLRRGRFSASNCSSVEMQFGQPVLVKVVAKDGSLRDLIGNADPSGRDVRSPFRGKSG